MINIHGFVIDAYHTFTMTPAGREGMTAKQIAHEDALVGIIIGLLLAGQATTEQMEQIAKSLGKLQAETLLKIK